MVELFWLLLPLAAASGWYVARRSGPQNREEDRAIHCGPNYYKGLNYLLNEQPDKAIEVFIEMLEVDSETVETHVALGNLFRRQGEVERAIRIHQNLIARPTLSRRQRSQALFELGQDYMRAGLYDRAESLFHELIEMKSHSRPALRQLVTIYQQEKDWERAIATAQKLETVSHKSLRPLIAQFYCELAERARAVNDPAGALSILKLARASDVNCVRATILQGNLEVEAGDYQGAIRTYKGVESQDRDFLSEVLGPLQECYRKQSNISEFIAYLEQVLDGQCTIEPMSFLANLIRERDGAAQAAAFLAKHLRLRPSIHGIDHLIRLSLASSEGHARDSLELLGHLTKELLYKKPSYKCTQCGFTGQSLHWQCPGCKSWSSVKPIQVVDGS